VPATRLCQNPENVPTDKVRILTANVGGSFGMKNMHYPEYTCMRTPPGAGPPVKWTDERSTSFLSDSQGPHTHARRTRARC